jgi:hypothetical protein
MDNSPSNSVRSDPIRDRFFKPWQTADTISNWLFFITAILSFLALLFDAKTESGPYNFFQTAFIIFATALFVLGQSTKLYFGPRAEGSRRQDFISYCLGANLTHLRTRDYYNNKETDPVRRTGAAVLENTLFTKTIVLRMLRSVRLWTLGYILVWLTALATRSTDLGWIAVAAQVLFSEQLVSRWLKMEWLRLKTEEIHNKLLSVFGTNSTPDVMKPYVLDAFAGYEAAKANAGILTSENVFNNLNDSLSAEWNQIKQTNNIL